MHCIVSEIAARMGSSLYYVSKRTGSVGWVKKMTIFADVQYCIYADKVGGWGPKRSKIC